MMAAATLLALGGLLSLMRVSRTWAYGIVVLAIAEMGVFALCNSPTAPLYLPFPTNWQKAIALLGRDDRVLDLNLYARVCNEAMVRGYDELYGYDAFILKRYWDFLCASQGFALGTEYTTVPITRVPNCLRMLRCRLVLYIGKDGPAYGGVRDPMPRVQLVQDYQIIPEREKLLGTGTSERLDGTRQVVLEEKPDPVPQSGGGGTAAVVGISTDALEITADVNAPSI